MPLGAFIRPLFGLGNSLWCVSGLIVRKFGFFESEIPQDASSLSDNERTSSGKREGFASPLELLDDAFNMLSDYGRSFLSNRHWRYYWSP